MKKRIALVSTLLLACGATATTVARSTVATAHYDPQKRDDVWSRALGEFQSRGVLVAVSDRDGGVLTSQHQSTEVPCAEGWCKAIVAQQLTLTPGGLATLLTDRGVSTSRADLSPRVGAQYQQETNDLLTAIAGSPAAPFLAPVLPKPSLPSPEKRPNATCETYQDCPPGSICTEGVCRP